MSKLDNITNQCLQSSLLLGDEPGAALIIMWHTGNYGCSCRTPPILPQVTTPKLMQHAPRPGPRTTGPQRSPAQHGARESAARGGTRAPRRAVLGCAAPQQRDPWWLCTEQSLLCSLLRRDKLCLMKTNISPWPRQSQLSCLGLGRDHQSGPRNN